MSNIYVAGIAMTVFGRHVERSLEDLAQEALSGALKDAGCQASDLGVAFYSGMTNGPLQGQIAIPGQVIFSKIGIEGIPVYNIENACASGSSGFNLAVQSLKAGTTDVALALGAEKMNIPDKVKAFSIFEAGWDVSRAEENYQTLVKMGEGVEVPQGSESDKPYSKFMAIYAALCRYHMPIEEFQRCIDINVFGVLRVTQAFLPLLGARKNCPHPPGRIVNLSSISGGVAFPLVGAYACSKHALEAMTDALRRELGIYGIEVVAIEPGSIQTPIWDKAQAADPRYAETDYADAMMSPRRIARPTSSARVAAPSLPSSELT